MNIETKSLKITKQLLNFRDWQIIRFIKTLKKNNIITIYFLFISSCRAIDWKVLLV